MAQPLRSFRFVQDGPLSRKGDPSGEMSARAAQPVRGQGKSIGFSVRNQPLCQHDSPVLNFLEVDPRFNR
jgi:hypothetical protein